jgi:hypothetical protein
MKRTRGNTKEVSLFLDSGAFSAYTKGVKINIREYISFIKKYQDYIEVYANLDVIGDPEETLKNQKIMERAGLNPLPCFHFGEDFKYLRHYIDNYNYIALGGVAQAGRQVSQWMDLCFDYICGEDDYPKVKVHGFAVTSLRLLLRYPWYSVDSTSWVMTSRMGSVYVPRKNKGRYVYDENNLKIYVSARSPTKKEEGRHIDTLPEGQREIVLDYFLSKGFELGESKVDSQGNEQVIKPGLCNDYKQRDQLNIIYFLDLEKNLPKWPWKFERKNVGFGL